MRAAVGGEVAKIILNRVTALDGAKERALIKGLFALYRTDLLKNSIWKERSLKYTSMSGYMRGPTTCKL